MQIGRREVLQRYQYLRYLLQSRQNQSGWQNQQERRRERQYSRISPVRQKFSNHLSPNRNHYLYPPTWHPHPHHKYHQSRHRTLPHHRHGSLPAFSLSTISIRPLTGDSQPPSFKVAIFWLIIVVEMTLHRGCQERSVQLHWENKLKIPGKYRSVQCVGFQSIKNY